ncbi:MAG: CHAT domain-containing tetratricopeptide repeat protein [Polyangiaceae bacterium]
MGLLLWAAPGLADPVHGGGGDQLARASEAFDAGDYPAARRLFRAAATALAAQAGPEAVPTLVARVLAAHAAEQAGDYAVLAPEITPLLPALERERPLVLPLARMVLATHHAWRGEPERAQAALRRAEQEAQDPATRIAALRRQGELALSLGDFEGAEELCLLRAGRDIQALSKGHPERVRAMLCWADAQVLKGNVRTAGKVYIESVSDLQQALGPDHPETARATLRLGLYDLDAGKLPRAQRLLARARDLLDARLGATSRPAILVRIRLARALARAGDVAQADRLFAEAVASARRDLPAADPDRAEVLGAFAEHQACLRDDYAGASKTAEEAWRARRQALGPSHASVGEDRARLAWIAEAAGLEGDALEAAADAGRILDERALTRLATGSEGQKRVNAAALRRLLEDDLGRLQRAPEASRARATAVALEAVLRRKGVVFDALAPAGGGDPELRRSIAEARAALAASVVGRARRGEDASLGDQGWWEAAQYFELRRLEARLRGDATRPLATAAAVASALRTRGSDEAVLIELSVYRPASAAERCRGRRGAARYAAFLLHPDGAAQAVDLGPAAPIDALVVSLRKQIQAKSPAALDALRELDERVMRPLRPRLGGHREIFLAPDGQLHLVPFHALRDERGHFLIESLAITLLGSGRDLLGEREAGAAGPPVVVGDPAYGGGGDAGESRAVVDLRRMRFPRLTGTAEEGRAVAELLSAHLDGGVELWLGEAASERALREVKGPRVLHIATHGYFLAGEAGQGGERALVLDDAPASTASAAPAGAAVAIEDPLLRAGLALRGANEVRARGARLGEAGADDGLLTAMEAASLDLSGTKLVVLSACETGVGEVHNGEGVIGLRRAFALAGAETQIMSLWKVSDAATRDLMIDTFRRLSAGGGRSESLREAQLAALADPARAHPYFWAAFFAAGDPTSLEGKAVTPRYPQPLAVDPVAPGAVPPGPRGCGCDLHARSTPLPGEALALLLFGLAARRRRPPPSCADPS